MRNLIILGTGRSGTSMVAGLFRNSGYYQGNNFIAPRDANKYGFNEDKAINLINNQILSLGLLTHGLRKFPRWLRSDVYRDARALWLAAPWFLVPRRLPPAIVGNIQERVSHQPFCFKDPRFSITLSQWRPFLPGDTRFIVVFRHPQLTVQSMLREAVEGYKPPLPITAEDGYRCWGRMYSAILHRHSRKGDWLFINYDDVTGMNPSVMQTIAEFTGADIDTTQIDLTVSRAKKQPSQGPTAPAKCEAIFKALKARAAEHHAAKPGTAGSGTAEKDTAAHHEQDKSVA